MKSAFIFFQIFLVFSSIDDTNGDREKSEMALICLNRLASHPNTLEKNLDTFTVVSNAFKLCPKEMENENFIDSIQQLCKKGVGELSKDISDRNLDRKLRSTGPPANEPIGRVCKAIVPDEKEKQSMGRDFVDKTSQALSRNKLDGQTAISYGRVADHIYGKLGSICKMFSPTSLWSQNITPAMCKLLPSYSAMRSVISMASLKSISRIGSVELTALDCLSAVAEDTSQAQFLTAFTIVSYSFQHCGTDMENDNFIKTMQQLCGDISYKMRIKLKVSGHSYNFEQMKTVCRVISPKNDDSEKRAYARHFLVNAGAALDQKEMDNISIIKYARVVRVFYGDLKSICDNLVTERDIVYTRFMLIACNVLKNNGELSVEEKNERKEEERN